MTADRNVLTEHRTDLSVAEQECLTRWASSVPGGCVVDVGASSASTLPLCVGAARNPDRLLFAVGHSDREDGLAIHSDRKALLEGLISADLLDRVRLLEAPSESLAQGWHSRIGLLSIATADQLAAFKLWKSYLDKGSIVIFRNQSIGASRPIIDQVSEIAEVDLMEQVGSLDVLSFVEVRASILDRAQKYPKFVIRPRVLASTPYYGNGGAYLYQPITKCGCTTIKTILMEFEGLPPIENEWKRHQKKFNRFPGLLHLRPAERLRVFQDETDTFKFVFVRNPFARAMSAYKDKIVGGKHYAIKGIKKSAESYGIPIGSSIGFADFINVIAHQDVEEMDAHWRPQAMIGRLQHIKFNFIGRFENMEADLLHALRHIGVPEHVLSKASQKHNATGSTLAAWDNVDPEIRKAFVRKFEIDFDLLSYPTQI